MPKGVLIVFSNAAEGQEEEFNRWYDDIHIPECLRVLPGLTSARRFEAVDSASPHKYFAIYEVEGDDLAGILPAAAAAAKNGDMSLHPSIGKEPPVLPFIYRAL